VLGKERRNALVWGNSNRSSVVQRRPPARVFPAWVCTGSDELGNGLGVIMTARTVHCRHVRITMTATSIDIETCGEQQCQDFETTVVRRSVQSAPATCVNGCRLRKRVLEHRFAHVDVVCPDTFNQGRRPIGAVRQSVDLHVRVFRSTT
jgi:hypothetical protein